MTEALGYDMNQKPRPIIDISRTPFESLWQTLNVRHSEDGGPVAEYTPLAFGPDVSTPIGPCPQCVVLLRKDVEAKLRKVKPTEQPVEVEKKFNLFPPGWKPAPGFTDPRKELE